MITSKAFAHQFNKLTFTSNDEFRYCVNMFVQGVLEIKVLKESGHAIYPLARMHGALHRMARIKDVKGQIQSENSDLNFYLTLLKLEELTVKMISITNCIELGLDEEDRETLVEYIKEARSLVKKLAFTQGISNNELFTKVLYLYKPLSLYRGSKKLTRQKSLKKKYTDEATRIHQESLTRYIQAMGLSEVTGQSVKPQ